MADVEHGVGDDPGRPSGGGSGVHVEPSVQRGRGRGRWPGRARRGRDTGLSGNGEGSAGTAPEKPARKAFRTHREDGSVLTLQEADARDELALRQVQGRRRQLLGLSLVVFVLVAGGVVLFSYASEA